MIRILHASITCCELARNNIFEYRSKKFSENEFAEIDYRIKMHDSLNNNNRMAINFTARAYILIEMNIEIKENPCYYYICRVER